MPRYIDLPDAPQPATLSADYSGAYGQDRAITRYEPNTPIPLAYGHCKAPGIVIRSHETTDQDNQHPNPSFETNLTGYSLFDGGAIERSSEHASAGTYSMKITVPLHAAPAYHHGGFTSDVSAITTAGEYYDFTFKLLSSGYLTGAQFQPLGRLFIWDDILGYQYWPSGGGNNYARISGYSDTFTLLSFPGAMFDPSSTQRIVGVDMILESGTGAPASWDCWVDEVVVRPYIPSDRYRMHVAYSLGEVDGSNDQTWVNDVDWDELQGTNEKTFYSGTMSQTFTDDVFVQNRQNFRGICYESFSIDAADGQAGANPQIHKICDWLKCEPIGGGTATFSRSAAVVLWDFCRRVKGIAAADLDSTEFQALETYCNAVPSGQTAPRYRFDYVIDQRMSINDIEKLICSSFHGRLIRSQGKWKPVWDHAVSSSYAFTDDNIKEITPECGEDRAPNIIRIKYRDEANNYEKVTLEWRDEQAINTWGEILFEETCDYIVDAEIARRRITYWRDKKKHCSKWIKLTCSNLEAGKLEPYDHVTVTHDYLGLSAADYQVESKDVGEDGYCSFELRQYNASIYHDKAVPGATDEPSSPPNQMAPPPPVENLDVEESSRILADGTYISTLSISWDRPNYALACFFIVWVKKGEAGTWLERYRGATTALELDASGNDTYYVKVQTINILQRVTPFATAPTAAVIVDGKVDAPTDVTWNDANCSFVSDITLVWNPIPDADLAFYEIRTADTNWGTNNADLVVQKLGTTHTITAPTSTSMTFYIRARDRSGNYSANADVITLSNDAPNMGTVTVDFSTNDCVLTWAPISQLILSHYTVQVYNNSAMGTGDLIYTSPNFNFNHFVFTYAMNSGCSGGPYRTLWFRVTATSKFGLTDSSDATGTNTAPATITTLMVIPGINSITTLCDPLYGDILGYEFACDTDNPPTDSQEVGTNFVHWTGLTGGETYYCRVRARDAFGYGEWSTVQYDDALAISIDETSLDIPLTRGVVWSCASGTLSWNAHQVLYKGTLYNIAAGNTTSAFVYWDEDSPTTYTGASSVPVDLGTWVMCYQASNVAYPAQQGKILHGGLIQATTVTLSKLLGTGSLSIGTSGTLTIASGGTLSMSGGSLNITGGTVSISGGTLSISSSSGISVSAGSSITVQAGSSSAGAAILVGGHGTYPGEIQIYQSGLTGAHLKIGGYGSNTYRIVPSTTGQTLTFGIDATRWNVINLYSAGTLYCNAAGTVTLYSSGGDGVAIGAYGSGDYVSITGAAGIKITGNLRSDSSTNIARIATGSYTGNGSTSTRTITSSLGFDPILVLIFLITSDEGQTYVFMAGPLTDSGTGDTYSFSHGSSSFYTAFDPTCIDIVTGGFAVKYGHSWWPNVNGSTYEYICIG